MKPRYQLTYGEKRTAENWLVANYAATKGMTKAKRAAACSAAVGFTVLDTHLASIDAHTGLVYAGAHASRGPSKHSNDIRALAVALANIYAELKMDVPPPVARVLNN